MGVPSCNALRAFLSLSTHGPKDSGHFYSGAGKRIAEKDAHKGKQVRYPCVVAIELYYEKWRRTPLRELSLSDCALSREVSS